MFKNKQFHRLENMIPFPRYGREMPVFGHSGIAAKALCTSDALKGIDLDIQKEIIGLMQTD